MHTLAATHDGHLVSSHPLDSYHHRSSSVGSTRSTSTSQSIPKIKSTNALAEMAASQHVVGLHGQKLPNGSEESLTTLPDPRNLSSSDLSRTGSLSPRHPDLSDEVAKLSDKLINAINHQTTLEDNLAQTRFELEASRARVQKLESEARAQEEKVTAGLLVPRTEVENEKAQLMANLADERKQKGVILQEKRGIENELETLTVSLFEEANKMVASANKERDAVERRNQQLRDQIKDTESLLANQQEQLAQLKLVMQQMGSEGSKEDGMESARSSTAPSSPSSYRDKDAHLLRLLEAMNLSPTSLDTIGELSPAPSTTLTHLLKPVCRTDLPAYEDFRHLLFISQKSRPASRVTSGSYAGLSVMGLGALTSSSSSSPLQPQANSSATSINTTPNQPSITSPQLPGSFSPNSNHEKGPTPLKELKFYKRVLVEDIEPTLRLDLSPTISWLSRRSILSALTENGLIVEPIPEPGIRLYGRITSCGLCGESRKDDANPRTHRMRVSEGEGATKWALCALCLEKVRATCDLVGYVRMVRDGVVRCADREEEQEAWEELIRLRERLFWARMAGGVVPSFVERASSRLVTAVSPSAREEGQAGQNPGAGDKLESAPHPLTSRPETHTTITNTTRRSNHPTLSTVEPTNPPLDADAEAAAAVAGQLHRNLADSILADSSDDPSSDPSTSMPGIRDVTPKTPPRFPTTTTHFREKKRASLKNTAAASGIGNGWGSHLTVNVPRAFAALVDDGKVNVLH
jgi:Rab guanine nucleotide exchange factor SEC2